jgi:hypothetical protein
VAIAVLPRIGDKPIIRRSTAEALLQCGHFEREDNDRLARGQAFHAFVASYFRRCAEEHEETLFTAVPELASRAWAHQRGLRQSEWDDFLALCDRFARSHAARLDTLVAIERTFTHDIGWALLTATTDRIDRIDLGDRDDEPTRIRIPDWKTEWELMDHWFQMRWYTQMAFLELPALEEVEFVIDLVRFGREMEPIVFVRGELDFWWETTLLALRDRVSTPGEPTGGSACADCVKRFNCARATALSREVPETIEQAVELYQEDLRLQEAHQLRWAGLERFFLDREPLVVGDRELGFLVPRDDSFVITGRPMAVVQALRTVGWDGMPLLTIPGSKITHKAVQQALVDAGVAEYRRGAPAFKDRKHQPAKQKPEPEAAK